MIKKTAISIVLQLISIPLLYFLLYWIASYFHEPYYRDGGGVDFYYLTLIYLTWFILITLPILNLIQSYWIKNRNLNILMHIGWFVFIVWYTQGDLSYRPYDYGLILFCVGSTILTRLIFNTALLSFSAKTFN